MTKFFIFSILAMSFTISAQSAFAQSGTAQSGTAQSTLMQSPQDKFIASQTPKNPPKNEPITGTPSVSNEPSDDDKISTWIGTIEQYEKALKRRGITEDEIDIIIKDATEIQTQALLLENSLRPQLNSIERSLNSLGNAPAEGESAESLEITERREALLQSQKTVDGKLKFIQLAKTKSAQLIEDFNASRRSRLIETTTERSYSLFSIKLWQGFFKNVKPYGKSISLFFNDRFQRFLSHDINDFETLILFFFGAITILILIAVFFAIARFIKNFLLKRLADEQAKEIIIAFYKVIKYAFIPILLIDGLFSFGQIISVTNSTTANVSAGISSALTSAIALSVISYIFLSPKSPRTRIFKLTDATAKRIFLFICTAAAAYSSYKFITLSKLATAYPKELQMGFNALFAASVTVILISALYLITKDHRIHEISTKPSQGLMNWKLGRPLLWVFALSMLVALFIGYLNLATFIADFIPTLLIYSAILWLLLEIIDRILSKLFHQNSVFSRDLSNFFGTKNSSIQQIGVILVGLVRILTVIIFFTSIAFKFGFHTSDWVIWVKRAFFGFSIGNIVISPVTIVSVIIIGILGFSATKAIQNWLGNQYLPTTDLDRGVQHSISTVFGYTGFAAVSLFAATYAGLNFQNLAIVFGALSVGIGFGLRGIIGNFVSGLILLAERPIKVGDWIITSGGEGTVKNISVRSTQIETFDRATIIVPNQTLITESVTNWTFRNELGRIKIAIGADYNSDPDQVRDILVECGKTHEGILNYPEPYVLFLNLGADALEFELRAYLKDIGNGAVVKSDLRFAILKAFREANINIPFPQRHVHIEGLEKLIEDKKENKGDH